MRRFHLFGAALMIPTLVIFLAGLGCGGGSKDGGGGGAGTGGGGGNGNAESAGAARHCQGDDHEARFHLRHQP